MIKTELRFYYNTWPIVMNIILGNCKPYCKVNPEKNRKMPIRKWELISILLWSNLDDITEAALAPIIPLVTNILSLLSFVISLVAVVLVV